MLRLVDVYGLGGLVVGNRGAVLYGLVGGG